MSTTEAFEFLKWIQETGNSAFLLGQGEQWDEWARAEGFKPEDIVQGIIEEEDASNHVPTFLDFFDNSKAHSSAFDSWIESTLGRLSTTQSAAISGLSGGSLKQSGSILQSNLHSRKERLNQELKELQELKNRAQDPSYSTVDHNNGCTRRDNTYIGRKGSLGQLDVTTYPNGSIQVYGDFYGSNGKYYKNNVNLMISDNIISRYEDLENGITRKNQSLVDKAGILHQDITELNYSLRAGWNTDMNHWTRQYILDSKTVGNIKSGQHQQLKHIADDKKIKQILEKLYHVDLRRSLNNRQKLEVFAFDWEVSQKIKANQKLNDAKREVKSKAMEVKAFRENIIKLENEAFEYEQIYRQVKDPVNDYITLFGRLRGNSDTTKSYHIVHYKNYSDEIQIAEKKAGKGNMVYAHNYEKKRANLAAKREELCGKSEARAVKASIATYQEAMQQGFPRKVSIGMAMATYLQTLVKEDLNFLQEKREEIGQIKDGWNSMSKRQRSQIERSLYLVDPYRREGFTLAGQVARETLPLLDVALSVGADILERQIKNTEKAYHDQKEHFSVLRLELLVSRLTLEYSMAERYEGWYANHPTEQYHVVKHWFKEFGEGLKHTLNDAIATFEAPFKASKAIIKGWSSGQGFIGGLHDGWDVEKNAYGHDIHDINHMVKGYQRLISPAFTWIPGIEKGVDVLDLVGHAMENIPSHIFKNVNNLGKQLYKVVTLQATWKGMYDGLGRDTRGVRHMVHHAYWLYNNIVVKGDLNKLIAVVSKDSSTAVKGAKIYIDRKEIKEAIVIKHDELVTRRTLHRHFHHLVKSPIRVLADDMIYNLRKDKAFADFRQNFAGSKGGETLLLAASLYGTSFYKNTEAKVDQGVKEITAELHHAFSDLKTDLRKQINSLTPRQKAVYIEEYENHDFPWKNIVKYELSTPEGKKLQLKSKALNRLPGKARQDLSDLEKLVDLALTDCKNYISSRQSNMQKRAQDWALNGGLLTWAKSVDQEFVKSVKQGCRFIQSPQGQLFKAKALDAYFLYKELNPIKTDLQKTRMILTSNREIVDTKKAYIKAKAEYKSYEKEQAKFQKQWNDWGMADGKMALTAYDVTFRPGFVIDTSTTPPTVTCTTLSLKASKRVNSNITSKKVGERFFMRLMWTQVLTQSSSRGTEFVRAETIVQTVTNRTELIIRELKRFKPIQTLSNKIPEFLASHILVKDLIIFEDGSKIGALTKSTKLKLETLKGRVEKIHNLVPAARKHLDKAVRKEKEFMQVMNIQVSEFNKTNFKIFEAHPFDNIKLLEVQAALAYDFEDQDVGKKVDPSRFHDWKTQTAKHNKQLSSDYQDDKVLEEQGANLTIEQVLVSAEPQSSPSSDHSLMHKWSSIHSLSNGKTRVNSDGSSGSSSNQISNDSRVPSIWIRLPHKDNQDSSSDKSTANLMMIWRNFKMIKHLYEKHLSPAKVEAEVADGENTAIAKGADSDLDFDSLISGDISSIALKANREAIRLDDDFNLFKDELFADVDMAVNRIDSAVETAEQQVVSTVEQDLATKEEELPHGQDLLKPKTELGDFGDTIIETLTADVTSAVSTEVEATQTAVETEITVATDTADTVGMDAADVMV